LFRLPVLFIIENNEYAMGTSVQRSSAIRDSLARRAEGYGMAWDIADGNNHEELRGSLHQARDRARHERLPTLLEVRTYRFEGHTIADANKFKYRAKTEVLDRQLNHDPIKLWGALLLRDGITTEEALASIREEAMQEAKDAAAFAKSSPYPSRAAITQDVYWEVDHQTTAGATGRHFFND
jgi:pyruvate dehydrogenase E1 component alpha subunit